MSSNNVFKLAKVGTAYKATETQNWRRTEEAAKNAAAGLKDAVEKDTKALPANTAEIVMRESQHTSDADSRSHYTAEAWDDKGNFLATVHVPVKK
ncbi:hypothetical protein LOCC1_G004536 [Lachnellula occidentalis]|uniref:Uncharacterized protein n=1 Tax=Lachnellula occidentalis TaxID=215460 RepID=A0A8H8RWH1_9HELO|nr:hypothetical protein LOCC1_G004536 [Lachnellula occidentalis]